MKKCNLIVLIDDNEFDCFVNRRIIEKLDFANELNVMKNGLEGIELIKTLFASQKAPNLIFLDLDMPVMNGFDFLKQYNALKKPLNHETKIVVLTSSSNPADFKLAKDLGCDAYLEKPLTTEKVNEIYEAIFVNT